MAYSTNFYNSKEYTIFVPSCRHALAEVCINKLKPLNVNLFDGTGYPSFSKLINDCIKSADTEIIIIVNDKARPSSHDVEFLLHLLESGFGFASLYLFGFFGLTKSLIKTIGPFDENFISGGYEDVDFKNRMIEANIAMWETKSIEYMEIGSAWPPNNNKAYYDSKWSEMFMYNKLKRLKPEPNFEPELLKHWPWSPWKHSVLPPNNKHLMHVEVINGVS